MNPKVTNIFASLNAINRSSPAKVTVKGTIKFPDWDGLNDHIQGIAPMNGTNTYTGCIAGSSSDGAYFAAFQAASPNPLVRSVRIWPDRPEDYDHAGGVQLLGSLLPLSVESDKDGDPAVVGFYDVANLSSPVLKYRFNMPDRKGSATAITNFTNGTTEKALLAVYEYEPRYMRFYVADVTAIGGNVSPWVDAGRYTGDLLGGDQYQNFALVTDTANQIFLLGFRENEELHVFRLATQGNPFRVTGMVREATYKDWNNVADWRYGVGAQIVSSSQIRIFGTDKDPSGSDNNYSFNIYIYS
jgi:hypothetical protein